MSFFPVIILVVLFQVTSNPNASNTDRNGTSSVPLIVAGFALKMISVPSIMIFPAKGAAEALGVEDNIEIMVKNKIKVLHFHFLFICLLRLFLNGLPCCLSDSVYPIY
ncbi:hypothetical protein D3C73_1105910 [compost metagenome]